MNPIPSEAEARRMYRILGNRVVEIRALRRGDHLQRAPSIGYFNNADDFADTAAGLSSAAEGDDLFSGVFMTINRLDDFFDELATNMVSPGKGARDSHVKRIRTLFLDLDPTRDHPRGGKVCSTDAEHVRPWRRPTGWPGLPRRSAGLRRWWWTRATGPTCSFAWTCPTHRTA